MPEHVKAPRRYDSPRRRQQAEATRAHILSTAQRQFERDGYVATTMAAIADESGVALKTVYLAFDTKSRLLRSVWDVLLRGPVDQPVADLPIYRQVLDEPDPVKKLHLNARNSRAAKVRLDGMFGVLRQAAAVDADAAELWALIERDFYANQRAIVETIPRNRLRHGVDATRATDILWSLNHPDVWRLLVNVRRWTPARFERWLAAASTEQLLAGSVGSER